MTIKFICRHENKLGAGKIGISESRCLGRCEHGPVAVAYPDNIWYQYISQFSMQTI
jgi:(2Fe-2S) ferredoxin